jgi:PAS domain S-box-containing protein
MPDEMRGWPATSAGGDPDQGASGPAIGWNAEGVVTLVNECAEKLFGWSAEELVGGPLSTLMPTPAEGKQASGEGQTLAGPEAQASSVTEVLCKDGSRLWMAWTTLAVSAEPGEPGETLAIGSNVTELVRSQAALGESEARFSAVAQAAEEGLVVAAPRGTWVVVSERMSEMLGYPRELLLGKSAKDFAWEGWDPAALDLGAKLQSGEALSGEFKFHRRNGSALWTHWSAVPLFDAARRHIGNLAMHTDVTERRRTVDQIRESEERYHDLFESMEEGFALCELVRSESGAAVDFRYLDVNSAFERFLHVSPDRVRGRLHSAVLPPDAEAFRWYVATVAKGRPARRQIQAASTGRWYDLTVLPRGESRFAVLYDDVTDQRQAEEELRKRNAEKAAQEERVRLARDLHDSVTQALFAATMKAEALAFSELESPHVSAAVADVLRLNRGALAEMRTLLLELRGDPVAGVPLPQLLRTAVEASQCRASVDVTLSTDGLAALPPDVHEAAYRITQEALNNIVHHAHACTAFVKLGAGPAHAQLTIADDGRGFDAASPAPGHFGLVFMRERALQSGGAFTIESGAGRGTTVKVEWPLGQDQQA